MSKEEDDAFIHSLMRITELSEAQAIAACDAQSVAFAKFEGFGPGQVVTNQYAAQGIYFLADAIRRPTITNFVQRNGLPTQSPPNSLLNAPVPPADSGGVPLVITFDPPVRIVSLHLGRITVGNPDKDIAILTAFDADGFPMGSVQRAIPDFNQGISAQLIIGAILPDQLISHVELNYQLNPLSNPLEPEHIDDLVICRKLVARQPQFPDAPQFGQQTVDVVVSAEVIYPVASGIISQPIHNEVAMLRDISINWERTDAGQIGNNATEFTLRPNEGEHLKLTASAGMFHPTRGPLTFLYWQQGENVYFARDVKELTTRILRNASFIAVYTTKRYNMYLPWVAKQPPLSNIPTMTATNTPTRAPIFMPTATPTATPTMTHTPTPSATSTAMPVATDTPTFTSTSTQTHPPTNTSTQTPTFTSISTPTNTPTITQTPTATATPATVTLTLAPIADAYVYSPNPTINHGAAPILYIGSQNTSAHGRAFFRFDLSAIPASATIQSASFEAYLAQSSSTLPSLDIEVRRVDVTWAETGVTWATQPNTSSIGKINGVGTAMGYYGWDVAGLVQQWRSGVANNGLVLVSNTEGAVGWRGFASRENTSPPRLVIVYKP